MAKAWTDRSKKEKKAYGEAVEGLYGTVADKETVAKATPLGAVARAAKAKKVIDKPKERQEQIAFVKWLSVKRIPYYAIANGGHRDSREAYNLKREGVQSGVPDLCIPRARGKYHGLYIEMKRQKGASSAVSDTQHYWLKLLTEEGYLAKVARGCDDAIALTEHYLSLGVSDEDR